MDTLDTHALRADHGDYLFRMARRQLHSDEEAVDSLFKQNDHWVEPTRPWGNPHAEE